ncbi:hypothetical protein [Roseovarius sp.]|jgi:hypothetical protein|uniref:hypothetical protein n=1 Tax=Roseovarius sp. TaxID=1486281 RepID=UPI002627492C|nr:hypothetical protein [Roseovarius sp.]
MLRAPEALRADAMMHEASEFSGLPSKRGRRVPPEASTVARKDVLRRRKRHAPRAAAMMLSGLLCLLLIIGFAEGGDHHTALWLHLCRAEPVLACR